MNCEARVFINFATKNKSMKPNLFSTLLLWNVIDILSAVHCILTINSTKRHSFFTLEWFLRYFCYHSYCFHKISKRYKFHHNKRLNKGPKRTCSRSRHFHPSLLWLESLYNATFYIFTCQNEAFLTSELCRNSICSLIYRSYRNTIRQFKAKAFTICMELSIEACMIGIHSIAS